MRVNKTGSINSVNIFWTQIFIAVVFICLLLAPKFASAASLSFSPSSGTYSLGQNFTVNVYLDSKDQASNAISGSISFPKNLIQVTSLSKNGSIMNLWVQDPIFSNTDGAVNFEGIILNPGYSGGNGKIINIGFKVRAVGNASLSFASASVLANDGQGTNILSGAGNAVFNLTPSETLPESATTPAESAGVPLAPKITSTTHPESSRWYANSSAIFNWNLPVGTTGVLYAVDHSSATTPTEKLGRVESYSANDFADGIWYFHLRLKNANGWGSISHYRFQIDTEPPQPFNINFAGDKNYLSADVKFSAKTVDRMSGIDNYTIKVDTGDKIAISPAAIEANYYTLNLPPPGKHSLIIEAVDKAGNTTTATCDFTVKGLLPPEFTDYPSELETGAPMVARGRTYPSADVHVFLESGNSKPHDSVVNSDAFGNFTYVMDGKAENGFYRLTAFVINKEGVKSDKSLPIIILVKEAPFIKFGNWAIDILAILIPVLALVILLAYMLWYSWNKFKLLKNRLHKDIAKAEVSLHEAFQRIRKNFKKQLSMLEKIKDQRNLTAEEEKISSQLKSDLELIEKIVQKEIQDIDKEIR